MIIDKLKVIIHLQNNIKLGDLEYTAKRRKHSFSKHALHISFLRDIHQENSSIEDADTEKSQLFNKLKSMGIGKIPVDKWSFLDNVKFLSGREKILNNYKIKIFPINIQRKFQNLNQHHNQYQNQQLSQHQNQHQNQLLNQHQVQQYLIHLNQKK